MSAIELDTTVVSSSRPAGLVDARGPRFAAWVTTIVLVVVLATGFWPLLAAQAVVFALGAAFGPAASPYGLIFRTAIAPRLSPPSATEPVAPLRFAQLVGLIFAVGGVAGYAAGAPVAGAAITGVALIAALLNAAFDFCLGCQVYPLVARLRARTS